MAHTPGPWKAAERIAHLIVEGAASETVASIPNPAFDGHGVTDLEERRANVRLLAVAPQMFAALDHAEAALMRRHATIAELAPIRAALRAAGHEGEGR